MKPHPRIRKTIKWGGAAVTLLLVVVWIGSAWFTWSRHLSTDALVICSDGGLMVIRFGPEMVDTIPIYEAANRWRPFRPFQTWGFECQGRSSAAIWHVTVPLWFPGLCTLALTLTAWRLDTLARRRARLNLCPKCNYDRAGIAKDAVCPECGSAGGAA